MYCIFCGKELSDDMGFCPYCGKKQTPSVSSENTTELDKSKSKKGLPVAISILVILLLLIIAFVAIRSCSRSDVSGIWVYDHNASENTEEFDLGTYGLILYLHEDGSIESNSGVSLKSYSIVDNTLKLVRPLGTTMYYDYKINNNLILTNRQGETAVFKKCDSLEEAEEYNDYNPEYQTEADTNKDNQINTPNRTISDEVTPTPTPAVELSTEDKLRKEDIYAKINNVINSYEVESSKTQDVDTADELYKNLKTSLNDVISKNDIEELKNTMTYTKVKTGGLTFEIPEFFTCVDDGVIINDTKQWNYCYYPGDTKKELGYAFIKIEEPTWWDYTDLDDKQVQLIYDELSNSIRSMHSIKKITGYFENDGVYWISTETDNDKEYLLYCYFSEEGCGSIRIMTSDRFPDDFNEIIRDIPVRAGLNP